MGSEPGSDSGDEHEHEYEREHNPDHDPIADEPADTTARTLPDCPRCGRPVVATTTTGPETHFASPCGCRLGRLEAANLQ
ncbi:hypothetical protein [Halomontanus rarus]|uniref:hypothetical protein n=1 Tax=Halomontanus rarus TaxID=3034020 RepID=UPI001A9940D7